MAHIYITLPIDHSWPQKTKSWKWFWNSEIFLTITISHWRGRPVTAVDLSDHRRQLPRDLELSQSLCGTCPHIIADIFVLCFFSFTTMFSTRLRHLTPTKCSFSTLCDHCLYQQQHFFNFQLPAFLDIIISKTTKDFFLNQRYVIITFFLNMSSSAWRRWLTMRHWPGGNALRYHLVSPFGVTGWHCVIENVELAKWTSAKEVAFFLDFSEFLY